MHRPAIEYNLAQSLLKRARLNPERTAMIFEGHSQTYAEFADAVQRQAGVLRENGVNVGDRVGFLGFNQPAFLQTLFAANLIGAIFVPLNFRLTAEELTFIINDAGVHSLVVDEALKPVIDPARAGLVCQAYYSVHADAGNDWQHLAAACVTAERVTDVVSVDQHEVSVIMYTSGTTGLPKGAMLTHGNIMWNNINSQLAFGGSREDVVLTVAPLFHIGGLNVMTLHTFAMGATVVLMRNFEPKEVLGLIEQYQVTHMFGAPAMFLFMSQQEGFAEADLSSIKTMICGAAPPPESLLTLYAERGVDFCQGYGLTETAPFASFLTPEWAISKLGSAGQPPMFTEVRIVDGNNIELPAGQTGEICIKGPNIMKGYWNRPEATAEAIDELGWFHSGDVGYFDDDGFLFICDRLKDMVISGGENVYPAEVESALFKHEAIAEVAVIGLADEQWGEAVTAVAALHAGKSLALEELREFATPLLARYKLPLRLHLVDALPRNPAGKVLKFKLKEQFSESD